MDKAKRTTIHLPQHTRSQIEALLEAGYERSMAKVIIRAIEQIALLEAQKAKQHQQ